MQKALRIGLVAGPYDEAAGDLAAALLAADSPHLRLVIAAQADDLGKACARMQGVDLDVVVCRIRDPWGSAERLLARLGQDRASPVRLLAFGEEDADLALEAWALAADGFWCPNLGKQRLAGALARIAARSRGNASSGFAAEMKPVPFRVGPGAAGLRLVDHCDLIAIQHTIQQIPEGGLRKGLLVTTVRETFYVDDAGLTTYSDRLPNTHYCLVRRGTMVSLKAVVRVSGINGPLAADGPSEPAVQLRNGAWITVARRTLGTVRDALDIESATARQARLDPVVTLAERVRMHAMGRRRRDVGSAVQAFA